MQQSQKHINMPRKDVSKTSEEDDAVHFETASMGLEAPPRDGPLIEDRERKEKDLVRKIDLRMMPLMMLLCTCPRPASIPLAVW